MAEQKTKNFELDLPEDKAEEWGNRLNDNFIKIDQYLTQSFSLAQQQLVNSGISSLDNNIYFTKDNFVCEMNTFYFPKSNFVYLGKPNTAAYTGRPKLFKYAATIAANDDRIKQWFADNPTRTEKIFYIGIMNEPVIQNDTIVEYQVKTLVSGKQPIKNAFVVAAKANIGSTSGLYYASAEDVLYQNDNGNITIYDKEVINPYCENHILLAFAYVRKSGETYMFDTVFSITQPWFANVDNSTRIPDMNTIGNFANGGLDINTLSPNIKNPSSWRYEGINWSNISVPHFKTEVFELKNSILNMQEILYVNNKFILSQENKSNVNTTKIGQLSGNISNGSTSKYAIGRIFVLGNGKVIDLLPAEDYASLQAAKNIIGILANPFQQEMYPITEVTRFIYKFGDTSILASNINNINMSQDNTSGSSGGGGAIEVHVGPSAPSITGVAIWIDTSL